MAGRKSSPRGSVRIIAGQWRGRRIPVAGQADIRPTSDRVRETLFNWLQPVIEGARCLDLFAGTGVLGLEALSRGAATTWFVDRDPGVTAALAAVIEGLDTQAARIVTADAGKFLHGTPKPFDVVFLDPPFEGMDIENLCKLLEQGWLHSGSRIYLELSKRDSLPSLPADWSVAREKTAGEVRFALAERP